MNAKIQRALASGMPVEHFSLLQLPERELEELGAQAFQEAVRTGIEQPEIQDLLTEREEQSDNSILPIPASQVDTQPDTQAQLLSIIGCDTQAQALVKLSLTKRAKDRNLRRRALRASIALQDHNPPEDEPQRTAQIFQSTAEMRARIGRITQSMAEEIDTRSRSQTPASDAVADSRAEEAPLPQEPQRQLNEAGHEIETQTQPWNSQLSMVSAVESQLQSSVQLQLDTQVTEIPETPETPTRTQIRIRAIRDLSGMSILNESSIDPPPSIPSTQQIARQFGDEISGNAKGKRPAPTQLRKGRSQRRKVT